MILKRYGEQLHSVDPHFDARAMNEIGFQRNQQHTIAASELEVLYELVTRHELTAEARGFVQTDAEKAALAILHEKIEALRDAHADGHVFVIENEAGKDYPKLREHVVNLVIESENKLEFHRNIDPPLRIAVYRPRQS